MLFDLPDDDDFAIEIRSNLTPDEAGPVVELVIRPDVDVYLAALETAVAAYEAEGQTFAAAMAAAPLERPDQLAWLGQQSLTAKAREQAINAVFEPAIRKPRLYLDRVYALRRRVIDGFTLGGATAARRYAERQRELHEIDRVARLEADRQTRAAQLEADRVAALERRRLADLATAAAAAGRADDVLELIAEARAVEAVTVTPVEAPPSQAAAGAVAGISSRVDWEGAITDIKVAVLAAARPDILREVAEAIGTGELTAGATSITTEMIATKLRALLVELPFIPATMFQGNPAELSARAKADRDTLDWPGFAFTEKTIPIRRPRSGGAGR